MEKKFKSVRLSNAMRDDIVERITAKEVAKYRKSLARFTSTSKKAHKILLSRIPKEFTAWVSQFPAHLDMSKVMNHDTTTVYIKHDTVPVNLYKILRELPNVHQRKYFERNRPYYEGDFRVDVPYTVLHRYSYRSGSALEYISLDQIRGLREHLDKHLVKHKAIEDKKDMVYDILHSVSTTKQLYDIWPEGWNFYKKYCTEGDKKMTRSLIPRSCIVKVNEAFKLKEVS